MIPTVIGSAGAARADLRIVGGKARHLAELASRGHRVPDFFVVSSALFEAVRSEPGVREAERELACAPADRVGAVGEQLRRLVAVARIDPQSWTDVLRAYHELLGGGEVAVRSSAANEDGAAHSFAGQLDTFLGVRGAEDLERAVRAVWASAYSPRALAYRRLAGVDHLPLAVVVQRMVRADVSGVLFTVDPAHAARLLLSATPGLGQPLVAGSVEGDTFTVDRRSLAMTTRLGDGRARAVLGPEDVRDLVRLGLRIERELGAPQDVEWARVGTDLVVLQARAITARGASAGRVIWDNSNIVESFPGITLPLTYSLARRSYASVYRQAAELTGLSRDVLDAHDAVFQQMIGLVRGRVYYALSSWYTLLSLLPGFAANKTFMEQMMGVRGPAAWAPRSSFRLGLRDGARVGLLLVRMAYLAFTIAGRVREFERSVDQVCTEHERVDLRGLRMDELVERYDQLERRLISNWQAPILNDFLTMLSFGLLRRAVVHWGLDATGTLANDLLRGETDMPSVEPARRIAEIARLIARDRGTQALFDERSDDELVALLRGGGLPAEIAAALKAYLDRYGHRCLQELKLERPSLRDDPSPLVAAVRSYLARTDLDLAAAARRQRAARADAEARARHGLSSAPLLSRLRGLAFWWVLGRARRHVRDREKMRFARARVFGVAREVFGALGRRLQQAAALDDAADVFYLTLEEACGSVRGTAASGELRGIVALRKEEFARYAAEPPLPDRFESVGLPSLDAARATDGPVSPDDALRGLPCCAGTVRGIARVLSSPGDGMPSAGEILVARETDPSWVTVFPLAAGILIERGSLLSHSAIVARELGIPTIVGVRGLTAAVRSGDLVEMDGSAGTVRRL